MDNDKTCGDCDFNRNGLCIVHRWDVSKGSPICSVYRKTYPGTVFQKITASTEVLAERLVYLVRDSYNGAANYYWCSTVADGVWKTKQEAIAATVAKLKEVCDE